MTGTTVTVARLYLTEAEHLTEQVVKELHDRVGVRGMTVFRGISGYGRSGALHSASMVDLSLNLPLVIEFFDTPERVEQALEALRRLIAPDHIVTWEARLADER